MREHLHPDPGGATRDYTLVNADGGGRLQVNVTGRNAFGSKTLTSGKTNPVIAEPATALSNPMLLGNAYVGETIVGNVGEWKAADTFFSGAGSSATRTARAARRSTRSTASIPRSAGICDSSSRSGKTIRMKVKANVGNDPNHTLLPAAVEVYTPVSAAVTTTPVVDPGGPGDPGDPGDPGGPGDPGADTAKPVISKLSITNKKFRVGPGPTVIATKSPVGTRFKLTVSEPATLKIALQRLLPGRRVKGKCVAPRRSNRKKPRCTRTQGKGTLTRAGLNGAVSIPFSGRVGKKKLPAGATRPSSPRPTLPATSRRPPRSASSS